MPNQFRVVELRKNGGCSKRPLQPAGNGSQGRESCEHPERLAARLGRSKRTMAFRSFHRISASVHAGREGALEGVQVLGMSGASLSLLLLLLGSRVRCSLLFRCRVCLSLFHATLHSAYGSASCSTLSCVSCNSSDCRSSGCPPSSSSNTSTFRLVRTVSGSFLLARLLVG